MSPLYHTVRAALYHVSVIDPAPGEDVSAALALVNTRYVDLGELVDDIADPDAAREWLARRAEAPRDMPLGNQ